MTNGVGHMHHGRACEANRVPPLFPVVLAPIVDLKPQRVVENVRGSLERDAVLAQIQ